MKIIVGYLFLVIAGLGGTAIAGAQPFTQAIRVGVLSAGVARISPTVQAFRDGLQALSYVEGRDVILELRYAEAKLDRLRDLAAELVHLKVAVIVTTGSQATHAAQQATRTIPIVMTVGGDPVAAGFVASLARPGGNITGLTNLSQDLSGKRVELLKETIPKLSRVGILLDPTTVGLAPQLKETEAVGRGLGLKLQTVEVRAPSDLEKAFQAAKANKAQALTVFPSSLLNNHAAATASLAVKYKLPAIYAIRESVEAGGLMSYGPSYPDMGRRAAVYVDKILKGAKAADLPVEQPMKFEFVINLNAAKQIGVTIPPNVLVRADKVIR
jgi:putative ABC transport system substrate-binding protein